MRIFFLSPIGCYTKELFPTFIETFVSKGHGIVNNIEDSDCIFFDMFSGLGTYDESILDKALDKEVPVICFDATDFGAMSKEKWFLDDSVYNDNTQDKKFIRSVIYNELPIVYFMRKMDKTKKYCPFVYPYEVCYYKNCDFEPASKEDLFNRPVDITFIGNESPTRRNVCIGLVNHFKCDFILGEERLPHEAWITRHRESKFFISADGGGFTDERVQQLFSISAIIKQRNNQLVWNDLNDMIDCVKVGDYEGKGVVLPMDVSGIKVILSNKDWLYKIYTKGIHKMKTYFSEEFRANYILETLKKAGIC